MQKPDQVQQKTNRAKTKKQAKIDFVEKVSIKFTTGNNDGDKIYCDYCKLIKITLL